ILGRPEEAAVCSGERRNAAAGLAYPVTDFGFGGIPGLDACVERAPKRSGVGHSTQQRGGRRTHAPRLHLARRARAARILRNGESVGTGRGGGGRTRGGLVRTAKGPVAAYARLPSAGLPGGHRGALVRRDTRTVGNRLPVKRAGSGRGNRRGAGVVCRVGVGRGAGKGRRR